LGGPLHKLSGDAGQDEFVVGHQDLAIAHGEEVPRGACTKPDVCARAGT
jgi:hypothetical protein